MKPLLSKISKAHGSPAFPSRRSISSWRIFPSGGSHRAMRGLSPDSAASTTCRRASSRMQALDHVSITVRDLARALSFYDAIFSVLEMKKAYERPDAAGYGERN